jgi:hypothetical protein
MKQKTYEKKKIVDCHKKKQEIEKNPRILQSNLKPLTLTLLSFFTIGILVYKTKESLRAPPPPQTWGSSLLPVGPLASSTQISQTQNPTPNGFGVKIWLNQHQLNYPLKRTSQPIR